jgi:DNA-binding response OmpR family regulator
MVSVLIIDDDEELALLLKEYLEQDGFEVVHIADGRRALGAIVTARAEIVVLDIMMPAVNGVEVLRRIRRETNIPVLMLTARGDEVDRISGLDLGADDYLAKPCSPGELAARLRAILRRVSGVRQTYPSPRHVLGPLEIDAAQRSVSWEGRALDLTGAEFNLLEALAHHVGQTVSRKQLSEQGLGRPLTPYDRAIDVHLSSIRQKIGALPDGRSPILNVRGIGYQLVLT